MKRIDRSRLRLILVLFFLALALPTAVLVWQAYSQLKWAAFHEYQSDAQQLTQRIDARLDAIVETADLRSFADYTFLVVSGDPSANFVQRSPLSAFPVTSEVPGVIGHFQIDSQGSFSTPLLPAAQADSLTLGIGAAERQARLIVARQLESILADNQLVRTSASDRAALASESEAAREPRQRQDDNAARTGPTDEADTAASSGSARNLLSTDAYTQEVFDVLSESQQTSRAGGGESKQVDIAASAKESNSVPSASKKESMQRNGLFSRRSKRTEQSALAEAVNTDAQEDVGTVVNVAGLQDLTINTFESEIDPFEFSLLGSGHFVLFRRVWRDGERYIQGMLLDATAFTDTVIGDRFYATTLADMTTLDVLYQDTVLRAFSSRSDRGYASATQGLNGTRLHRHRLVTPLNSMTLSFDITRLPPGPGANVLLWVSLVLAIVLIVGFTVLYRTGLTQLALVRQQQDFVSAVSHELKSPLTSIRMYGEMLKEGWADEQKRQSYYEYIHDESERLSRLISNVLQLANISKGEPQVNLREVQVATLMDNAQSRIVSQAERAGFTLAFETSPDAAKASLCIDDDCFVQMIINLVDNAIKFSKEASDKTIDVRAQVGSDGRIQFSVRDYGPGVAKDQMKKIFEMFYRSESELTRETVGTGIGLAIVHQLANVMNGDIDMVNVEPGAEFRFWFPITRSGSNVTSVSSIAKRSD